MFRTEISAGLLQCRGAIPVPLCGRAPQLRARAPLTRGSVDSRKCVTYALHQFRTPLRGVHAASTRPCGIKAPADAAATAPPKAPKAALRLVGVKVHLNNCNLNILVLLVLADGTDGTDHNAA